MVHKNNKLDFMKMYNFCTVKESVKELKELQSEKTYLQTTYLVWVTIGT